MNGVGDQDRGMGGDGDDEDDDDLDDGRGEWLDIERKLRPLVLCSARDRRRAVGKRRFIDGGYLRGACRRRRWDQAEFSQPVSPYNTFTFTL